jgi:hypothetical protein
MLRQAKQRKALVLVGAEASCAPWGSLRDTWAPTGQQPEGPPRGNRQASNVCGLSDSVAGHLFSKAPAGRCNAESDQAFVLAVLAPTPHQVVVMQAGTR